MEEIWWRGRLNASVSRRPVKCASVCSSNEHRVATDGQAVVHAGVRCDWTTHGRTNRERTRAGRVEHNHAAVLSSAGRRVFPAGPQTTHQHIGDLITAFKITDLIPPQSWRCNGIKSAVSEMLKRPRQEWEMYSLIPLNCLHVGNMMLRGLPRLLISRSRISGKLDLRHFGVELKKNDKHICYFSIVIGHFFQFLTPQDFTSWLFMLFSYRVVPRPVGVRLGLCPRLDPPRRRHTTRSSWGHS